MSGEMTTLADRAARPRRNFLARMLGLGAGASGLALAGSARTAEAQQGAINDAAILNFALNLEYLEGAFYTYAVTGAGLEAQGIPTSGSGNFGPDIVKANSQVPFTSPLVQQFAMELAIDEQKHILDLRNLLSGMGVTPVAKPAIDLLNSFNLAARMAGLGNSFDPFASDVNFLLGSYVFEDVGVTAYHGASPFVTSPTILGYAAGILAVEGYHAGSIRAQLYQANQGAATQAISNLRATASAARDDYGVAQGPGGAGPANNTSIVLSDATGQAFARSFRQVLNVVYLAPNAPSGGFFPNGVNGPIR